MRKSVAFLAALLVTSSAFGTTTPSASDANGREWHFRVLLDDTEVGWHRYVVRGDGEATEVSSQAQFDVPILFLNYRYRHEARERWRGACLDGLESRTATNGKVEQVDARAAGGTFRVSGPSGEAQLPRCVMSFAYWDPRILQADRLLNSQTGEWLPVRAESRGVEQVQVGGRSVLATRHRLTAPDLRIDLWYADGRWVALEAPTPGGRLLRYELR